MPIQFTPQMQAEYQRLFDTCVINPGKLPAVNGIVQTIINGKSRYDTVSSKLGIPWYFIGIVHNLEGSSKFTTHLHNGDPLSARTVQVPKGRPKTGNPPFQWEFSAEDALVSEGLDTWTDWSLPGVLFKLEGYNGFGYRKAGININSPYLWSFSNQYTKGKFVRDGEFSPTAVSGQCGAAILVRRLTETQNAPVENVDRIALIRQLGETISFAPNKVVEKARELQKMMNLAGAHLLEDGKAGTNSSDAYSRFIGKFLPGDPRRTN
jgi:lysozyme family protein